MEIGLSKSSHLQWVNNTPPEEDNRDHLRSYRCSFCKRGFSNAQALGGHMNIHRKDRAKLKSSLFSMDHNTLSLDSGGVGGGHEHHHHHQQYSEINEDGIFRDKLQLTLSVKSSPETYSGGSSRINGKRNNMKQLIGASAELDLDLHL